MFPGGRVTILPARLLFGTFSACVLFTATASAQRVIPPVAQQDDRSDSPLLRQGARAREQPHGRGGAKQDDPRARLEWQRRERGIPSVEFKQHLLGLRQSRSAPRNTTSATTSGTSGPVWVPIGPTGADYEQNGSFTGLARDSGRARTILPHPTDANTVYFLTSGGGLWVTNNFTASPPTWTPLTDSLVTTGGGSAAFGRTPNVLYLGLGDPFDLINSGGVMVKSIDGGMTWTNMVDLVNAFSVRDVKVDTSGPQDIVLVATDFGLFRSPDGGVTYAAIPGPGGAFTGEALWSLAQTSAGWLVNAQPCSVVPATACGTQATIYFSTDHGATWAAIPNGGNVYTGAGRTTLAVGAPGDSVAYAFAENSASTDQLDLFRSTDGGMNWMALGINAKVPTNPNTDNPNMDLMHSQSFYNQMILVDPRDASRNTLYLGGDLSSAKSTDGGKTWTLSTNWLYGFVFSPTGQPGMLPYVHADFHAAALSMAGTPTVMFGSDGGLFISTDNGATWSSDKNNGLQTFLFYSLISAPGFPSGVFGGSQDNGTRVRKGNTTIYNQSLGGDGFGTGWSQANADAAVATTEFNDNEINLTNQIPDLIENFIFSPPPLINDGVFYTPVETPTATADPTGKVFFTSSGMLIDKSTDGGWTWAVIGQVGVNGIPSTISLRPGAHAVGASPIDLLHVGVIASGGHVEITTNGGTSWTDRALNTLVPGFMSFTESLTWADNQTIYVTSVAPLPGAVRIAKSSDGGGTWARADGGLPDVPTDRVIVDPRDLTHNTLLAAGYLGVYRSTNGGANWGPYGAGLPNVRVSDLYMPPDGSFVRLASYGRGMWELPFLAFSGATLTDDLISCNHDGVLDNNETGRLTIALRNDGGSTLSNITATVTSTNPSVSFPFGKAINFPSAAPSGTTTASIPVALKGAVGIQETDFNIAFTDPALNLPASVSAIAPFRANADEIPNGSANDNIEATNSSWTVAGTPQSLPDSLTWQRRQITPIEHRWAGPDSNAATDISLVLPVLTVGGGTFTISFEQRYFFQTQFGATPAYFDGMVLELSKDGGTTWNDIGANASPGYDHVLATGTGNVLQGRSAYSSFNANYPGFTAVTVNLGTQFAGQNVQIRFRVGTAPFVFGGSPGVEIRNITTSGLTNTPFTAAVPDRGICSGGTASTSTMLASGLPSPVFGQPVTFTATVTSAAAGTPTGTVTFFDGANQLGTGMLNAQASASLSTSSLASGSHAINAVYGADSTFAGSAASPLTQVVNQASTSTTVSSVPNPSSDSEVTVFTATVTATPPGGGTPDGSVQFFDGAASLGTKPLTGGMASLSASGLTMGTHNITAAYSGSSNYVASTSPVYMQTVLKKRARVINP